MLDEAVRAAGISASGAKMSRLVSMKNTAIRNSSKGPEPIGSSKRK
jgi:hypothetical protein